MKTKHNRLLPSPIPMTFRFVAPLIILCLSGTAWAATYHCISPSGEKVYTDSPAQLENCQTVTFGKDENRVSSAPKRDTQSFPPSQVEQANNGKEIDRPSSSPNGEIISLTRVGGSLTVQALLNRSRYVQLIVDTGATTTVLSTAVAIDLGLLSEKEHTLATINTAGGPVQASLTQIDTIQVSSAEARNITVAIHDLPDAPPGVDGLLGMSFLSQFLVTLDTSQQHLLLRPPQQERN